jgi:hypothetical protein
MSVQPAMPPLRPAVIIPLAELEILEAELAALHVQHIAIGESIAEITRRIVASAAARLRQQQAGH